MLAAHSKKLEHSLTQSAASIRPASPTAGRAAVEQTEPFQHGGGSLLKRNKEHPPKDWKIYLVQYYFPEWGLHQWILQKILYFEQFPDLTSWDSKQTEMYGWRRLEM